jgi:hypothetical protein
MLFGLLNETNCRTDLKHQTLLQEMLVGLQIAQGGSTTNTNHIGLQKIQLWLDKNGYNFVLFRLYPITCRRVVDPDWSNTDPHPDIAFLLNPDELYILPHTGESM